MSYDTEETTKTHEALQTSVRLFVYYRKPSWVLPNGDVRGWKVLVEQVDGQPFWITTYYKELTENGYQFVQYDHNSRGERIIKPDKG